LPNGGVFQGDPIDSIGGEATVAMPLRGSAWQAD
jgi:hypothetical protein